MARMIWQKARIRNQSAQGSKRARGRGGVWVSWFVSTRLFLLASFGKYPKSAFITKLNLECAVKSAQPQAGVRRHKVLRLKSPHSDPLLARAGRGRPGQCQDAPRHVSTSKAVTRHRTPNRKSHSIKNDTLTVADTLISPTENVSAAVSALAAPDNSPRFWTLFAWPLNPPHCAPQRF